MNQYEIAALKGHVASMFACANLYYNSGKEEHKPDAFKWYLEAAKHGVEKAYLIVAEMYHSGEGTEANDELAKEWYYKAMQVDDFLSRSGAKDAYVRAYGVDKTVLEPKNIKLLYNQEVLTISGEANDSKKVLYLSNYEDTYGMRDDIIAIFDRNSSMEKLQSAIRHLEEDLKDVERYERFLILGDCYYYGRGVEEDCVVAKEYYNKAMFVKLGLSSNIPGDHVEGDYLAEFLLLYRFSKEELVKLGWAYYDANHDLIAHYLFYNLAQEKIPAAQNAMGLLLEKGRGVTKDIDKAFSYYQLAAEQDYPGTYLNLGRIYSNKELGFYDLEKAKRCYKKGAALGNQTCMKKLEEQAFLKE